jgi:hypothetical protein
MRSRLGRVACASRTASWSVGSTRGKLSPGSKNDHDSLPNCFPISVCISFGSTLSVRMRLSESRGHGRSLRSRSNRDRADQECGVSHGHRRQGVKAVRPAALFGSPPRGGVPTAAVHSACRELAWERGTFRQMDRGQYACEEHDHGLSECPQRLGSTDDGGVESDEAMPSIQFLSHVSSWRPDRPTSRGETARSSALESPILRRPSQLASTRQLLATYWRSLMY